MAPPPPPPSSAPPSWAARLLERLDAPRAAAELTRLGTGLALASLFGVAVGLRRGQASILVGALGVPAGILAVAAVAVPAFAIVLALANAPIEPMDLAHATSRAASRAGLLLAGLSPGMAMLAVTCEENVSVSVFAALGLLLAGGLAAGGFSSDLGPRLREAPKGSRAMLGVALPGFLVFSAVLAARVWWLALPMLTGAS